MRNPFWLPWAEILCPLPGLEVHPISFSPTLKKQIELFSDLHASGLNVSDYHFGPGPELMLATEIFVNVTPIWNVCARFNGTDLPDEYVILGTHLPTVSLLGFILMDSLCA